MTATLAVAGSGVGTPARAESLSYAAFRVVKSVAGGPTTPQITLPDGYALVPGTNYQVTSRAEYYAFVQGPRGAAVTISVRWPAEPINTVITGKTRLRLTRDAADPFRVTFTLPVTATSASAAQSTLQVFSYPSGSTASGVYWRIEHNDPNRAAGYWAAVSWPATQTRAAINYSAAAEAILQDSGLAAEARRRGHFFALMGFETNNLLHLDNPPHWHLSYYPGLTFGAPRAHVPHFWMDAEGRTFYNGMDIQGQGRTRYYAGDPAPIRDVDGNLVVTLTIRADGGLDIDPPAGPRYSIVAQGASFGEAVRVLRGGVPWRSVVTDDNVTAGVLVTTAGGLGQDRFYKTIIYRYDPLTGPISNVWRGKAEPTP